MEKFAAFIGSLSPQEQGEVMPLMLSYMQSNQGVGMGGASMGESVTPPAPAGDAGPAAAGAAAAMPPGAPPAAAPAAPMPGLQPGGLMDRPPMPPTQIGNKAY
jgi:hypothetical protein